MVEGVVTRHATDWAVTCCAACQVPRANPNLDCKHRGEHRRDWFQTLTAEDQDVVRELVSVLKAEPIDVVGWVLPAPRRKPKGRALA